MAAEKFHADSRQTHEEANKRFRNSENAPKEATPSC